MLAEKNDIIKTLANLDPFVIYTGGGPEGCIDYSECTANSESQTHSPNCIWHRANIVVMDDPSFLPEHEED